MRGKGKEGIGEEREGGRGEEREGDGEREGEEGREREGEREEGKSLSLSATHCCSGSSKITLNTSLCKTDPTFSAAWGRKEDKSKLGI